MAVTVIYHGHSNVEIHHESYRVQLDPFYTGNPLADVKADAVNPTHILISHAHGDHVGDALAIAKRTKAVIAGNYEIVEYLKKQGAPEGQGMNQGGGCEFSFGRATLTPAIHSSSFPDGTYGGLAGGWVIEIGGKVIYFAGDTALFSDMELIGKFWRIDLACLPIGDVYTMGPVQAVRAAELLNTKYVLPMHYDTYPAIRQNAAKFAAELHGEAGIAGIAMKPGQSMEL